MISKNNGGADQPVSRLIDSGGEAYIVDAAANTASVRSLSMVYKCTDETERQSLVMIYPRFYKVECGEQVGCFRR